MPRKKQNLDPNEPISELNESPENQEAKPAKKAAPRRGRTPRPAAKPVSDQPMTETIQMSLDSEEEVTVAFRSIAKREPAPQRAAEKKATKPRGRGKQEETPPAETADLIVYDGQRDENDLPIPIWRPIAAAKPKSAPRPSPAKQATTSDDEEKPARGRGRDRRKKTAEPEPAAIDLAGMEDELPKTLFRKRGKAAEPVASPKRETKPKPEPKALIPIPADAPQVVLREGIPTLTRNGRVYPPAAFFGNCSDEKRTDVVLEEIRLASEAGIHIHSVMVDLEVNQSSVDQASRLAAFLLTKIVKIDADAQVLFRLVFVAPRGWESDYPDARYVGLSGEAAEPSLCDNKYWAVAKNCMDQFIRQMRMLDLKDNILGVHLERGEWFVPVDGGYDTSTAAKAMFKDWIRARYSEDEVALRASWFDGNVDFDTVQIPAYQPEGAEGDRFVRSSRKQRRYVDYHLFISDAIVERIADLAYAAKVASAGYFLVGASYGYTFEWAHPSSGHLALGKLLRTPEVDFIAGPPSYKNREPGGTGPFPSAIDSFALNGKLYISEDDFKTAIGGGTEPDEFNPVIRTPQALESIHWRGAGAALAHASGVNWMDLWGNGWLKTASIWDRAQQVRDALTTRMAAPLTDPDVAVFVDERALAYLVDPNAFRLLIQNGREAALRSGLSVGFFLLSDLAHRERFPESKLYVFLNAWDIRPELRSAIKERLHRDNKVLFWLYSAGLFDSGRDSLERARDVTGIALKPQPFHSRSGSAILNRRHPLVEAFPTRMIPSSALEPSYFGINEDAMVLGEYTQTGLPSFVLKDFNEIAEGGGKWTSVFLGEPAISPSLIRALGQMAGAHVWNFQDDLVHVRPPFLTVHCKEAGPRTITLPSKWSAYNLLTKQWAAEDTTHLRFTATAGSTHVFLVGLHGELENLLATDPSSVLTLEGLPEHSENTVRFDAVSFDVPIMRLNEWIEGGVTDDVAEELLFRPKFEEDEAPAPVEESSMPGSRRRKRRRGNRGGSEETASVRREGADREAYGELEINVMFRKRE